MRAIVKLATLVVLVSGCAKMVQPEFIKEGTYVFKLHSPETKTQLSGRTIAYETDDKAGIFYKPSSQGIATVDASTVPVTMTLSTGVTITPGSTLYAYYPYRSAAQTVTAVKMRIPLSQYQDADTYDSDAMPMASLPFVLNGSDNSSAGDIYMRNLAAVVEFNIYSTKLAYTKERIVSVSVEAQDGVAGDFEYNITTVSDESVDDIPSLADKIVSTHVSSPLSFGTGKDKAAKVYMVLKPGVFTGYVRVRTDAAEYVFAVSRPIALARSEAKPLGVDLNNATRTAHGIKCEWVYGGSGKLNRFEALVPAVDAYGNVYVTETGSTYLHKIYSDGTLAWKVKMQTSAGETFSGQYSSPSLEPDGNVVYAGGGQDSGGCFFAYDALNGTKLWEFSSDKFFASNGSPSPKIERLTAVVGDKNIYIGNTGTTGSVLAINKTTGTRVSYVGNNTGTGGPAGGVRCGISMSAGGSLVYRSQYGTFASDRTLLDSPIYTNSTFGAYAPYYVQYRYGTWSGYNGNIACLTIGGVDHFATFGVSSDNNMHIICGPLNPTSGWPASTVKTWKFDHTLTGVKKQDQGGVVIGPQNEIIVSLKHNNATYPGGVYAVNSSTSEFAWRYDVQCDVAGAPAVDNAGNVHFIADDGMYYIVRPNYSSKNAVLVASASVFDLVSNHGFDMGEAVKCKSWTSPIIGQDGKIYVAVYFRNSSNANLFGTVVCLSYEGCHGAGNTPWPMRSADCFNSGRQHDMNANLLRSEESTGLKNLLTETIAWQNKVNPRKCVYVVAHRANTKASIASNVPENSIRNIEMAIAAGVDMVELDVRVTKDGELVLMHDETIDRTTTGSGKVSDFTLSQLRAFDMKRNSTVSSGVKVPTLLEALNSCKDKVYVNLDMSGKSIPIGKCISIIRQAGMEGQVMMYLNQNEIKQAYAMGPELLFHPFVHEVSGLDVYQTIPGARLVQYNYEYYMGTDVDFAKSVRARGFLTYSNILANDAAIQAGDYSSLDKFIASETDFIQTDYAETITAYLKTNNLK